MNNVDHIIKYLSGEMNREEAGTFEDELASNQELKKEFDQVSEAYKLIRDQLLLRDEKAFKSRLMEVMEAPAKGGKQAGRTLQIRWYSIFALAASVALVLAILLSQKNLDKQFSKFYHPEDDRIVLAHMQETRGETESGILHYQLGNFQKTLEIMSELLEQDQDNQWALLYYLLSSIETDQEERAIEKVAAMNLNLNHQLGQALYWYSALALIKSDRPEEAATYLQALIQQEGPYRPDARRLEKIVLK